ncbi:hypothetical protein MMC34_008140 [Xylographa carneopallida]|nr:hypothetical protein [Xylographa carneopallida]
MSLSSEVSVIVDRFSKKAPSFAVEAITAAGSKFQASFNPASTIQVGETLPEFHLSNALGQQVHSVDMLAKGPLLISFYRGEWCPFCNLELRTLQKNLDKFTAKGVTLVAISPELPNQSLSTTEKHELKFPVLSEVGNKLAKQLGIIYAQPDSLRPVFEMLGNDLKKCNGDDSFEVPFPATLLVDRKGVVRNMYVDADYRKLLEPETALEWVEAL